MRDGAGGILAGMGRKFIAMPGMAIFTISTFGLTTACVGVAFTPMLETFAVLVGVGIAIRWG